MANIQLPFSATEITKILDEQYKTPLQDVVGDDYTVGSPLAVSASTEYPFTCNGNVRNFTNLPDHVTSLWNVSTDLCVPSELLDTPVLVFTVRFKFDPTLAAAGTITINPYVNEAVPIKFKPVTVPFKATITDVSALVTIYLGSDVGFDVKNKGVFFKFESTGAGNMYNPSIEIYRT